MNNHNFSKHQWWKTCRKELMRSLTRCVRANILMTWLRVGSQKLPIRLEYQIFYKLTKTHVPILVGRSIISGCEGPTERISSLVETLPQPMVQLQQSYMKDATAFHQFHRKSKGRQRLNVSSLYTNTPQEEGTKHTRSSTIITHRSQRTTLGKRLA